MIPILEIHQLKKTFLDPEGIRHTILDIPYFSMNPKEQVALLGQSGGGKTTLLHLISGIYRVEEGSIHFDGIPMGSLSESKRDRLRASSIGYIFQTFNLLQGFTCLENLTVAMSFAGLSDPAYAKDLLKRVGLEHRLHYYPRQLSTGQQQRIAVARALANRPKLILADEPTGNLDPENAQAAMDLLREICREHSTALLLVSHAPHLIKSFSRVVDLGDINFATSQTGSTPAPDIRHSSNNPQAAASKRERKPSPAKSSTRRNRRS